MWKYLVTVISFLFGLFDGGELEQSRTNHLQRSNRFQLKLYSKQKEFPEKLSILLNSWEMFVCL